MRLMGARGAAALAALTVSACSSTTAGRGAAPSADLVSRLVAGVAATHTVHITLQVGTAGKSVIGSGDEVLSGGRPTAFRISEQLPGGTEPFIVLFAGGRTYATLPASLNPTGKRYVLLSPNSRNPVIARLSTTLQSSLSSASVQTMKGLVTAAKSVRVVGTESVDGTATTHYGVVVEVAELPTDVPNVQQLKAAGLTTIPVDLWLDGKNRIVRLTENLTVQGQHVATTVDQSRFNQPVTITAPPPNEVGHI